MGRVPAESLPPQALWPKRLYTPPEFRAYPQKLNGTEELPDKTVAAGEGLRFRWPGGGAACGIVRGREATRHRGGRAPILGLRGPPGERRDGTMLSKAMQDALNDQIKKEFASAYLYLAMSAHFEAANLPGCAHWMRIQNQEEAGHGMKFFAYVNDRGGRVTLQAIDQPPGKFKSPRDVFQQTLEHERKVTESIHKLNALAVKENDYATQAMLQWFITEQVEEEKRASQLVEELKLAGDEGAGLLLFDRQLAARAAGS